MPMRPMPHRACSAHAVRRTLPRHALSRALVFALVAGVAATASAQNAHDGAIGDPDSWRTAEFEADWGLGAIGAHHAYARGLTGAGVELGLFDTGVAMGHTEFAGRGHQVIQLGDPACATPGQVRFDGCFFSSGDQPSIDINEINPFGLASYLYAEYQNHGTHVAGTMVAARDGQGMHGVAYGSRLHSARFFADLEYHWFQDADGIWERRFVDGGWTPGAAEVADLYDQLGAAGARALNVEIWLPVSEAGNNLDALRQTYESDRAYYDAYADGAIANDVLTVVALGNDNGRIANIYPGLPEFRPDAESLWLSVANVQDNGNGAYSINSSSSICAYTQNWCIAAPGTLITSSVDGGGVNFGVERLGSGTPDDPYRYEVGDRVIEPGYADFTGTSMAAPHAIGALALLFERFPYLSSTQVRDVMLTTATDLGEEGVDEIYGWGLINLERAVDGPGQLLVDTDVVMDRPGGGTPVWEGPAWDDWRNDIGGPGRLTKAGVGWLRLSGDNSFAGATVDAGVLELDGDSRLDGDVRVAGGALLLNGSLTGSDLSVAGGVAVVNGRVLDGDTRVDAAGTLGGSGRLGDTWVAGTIAPGNSIGTLTVDGDYTQLAGSTFEAELLPPDTADLLHVTGAATIEGGTLRAIPLPGTYLLGQNYQIIRADGGLDGTFDRIDTEALSPFLSLSLAYAANGLRVDVARGAALASAAVTPNQFAVAAAADALAFDQGLPVALTQLSPDQAADAFDQLSGEAHASTNTVLLDSGRLVRNAALARAAYGQDAFTAQHDPAAATGAWVDIHRNGGRIDADGNAARVQSNSSAILVGVDHAFGGWRVGVFGGTGRTDSDIRQRGSKSETDSRHAGLYASNAWGAFGLRAGYSYTWHEVDTERRIGFAGFSDTARARYDADAWQAFVEAGWRFESGAWGIEPYLQYAHVELDADGFAEDGGAAALAVRSSDARVDLTTAGVRFDVALRGSGQEQSWLSLRGNLGYRYAGGDQRHSAWASWDGGDAFVVRSPAITDEAALVELGFAARTSSNSLFEVGYSGVLSGDARDHGANARFSLQF